MHLDVLRGFALLGILLANFQLFTQPIPVLAGYIGLDEGHGGANRVADAAILWLAEGKFYPLFAMLFGGGFVLMWERTRESGRAFWPAYLRRILALGFFGLAHLVLIWGGDILLIYSLSALLMVLFFRNTPTEKLWKWGLALIFFPSAMMWLYAGLYASAQADPESADRFRAAIEADREYFLALADVAERVHTEGSYLANVQYRVWEYTQVTIVSLEWMIAMLGFFLLGRFLVQSGRLTDITTHEKWLRRWRLWGLCIGLPIAAISTWLLYDADWMVPAINVALGMTLLSIAGVILSLGYLATVVLARKGLAILAPAGRMALTNYLLQSLFWTLVFYGYGLGAWQQIDRIWHVPLGVGFFGLQVIFSHWWLQHFHFGPTEWLWRCFTYFQWYPLRRVGADVR